METVIELNEVTNLNRSCVKIFFCQSFHAIFLPSQITQKVCFWLKYNTWNFSLMLNVSLIAIFALSLGYTYFSSAFK